MDDWLALAGGDTEMPDHLQSRIEGADEWKRYRRLLQVIADMQAESDPDLSTSTPPGGDPLVPGTIAGCDSSGGATLEQPVGVTADDRSGEPTQERILQGTVEGTTAAVFNYRYATVVRDVGTPQETRSTIRMGGNFVNKALFHVEDNVKTGREIHCELFDEPRVIARVDPAVVNTGVSHWMARIMPRSEWNRRHPTVQPRNVVTGKGEPVRPMIPAGGDAGNHGLRAAEALAPQTEASSTIDSGPAAKESTATKSAEAIAERAARRQAVVDPILKERRWKHGRLATEAGLGKNSVYEYLDGTRVQITAENRKAIAEALGLRPDELPN